MKDLYKYRALLLLGFVMLGSVLAYAQDKKYRARVSLQYTKIMDKESYIGISAKYKGKDGFDQASDLEFSIYKVDQNDSLIYLGKVKTNENGKAKFLLAADELENEEATVFNYIAKIENNERFEDGETSVSFSVANLTAKIEMIDSVNQISAVLTDASGIPLQEVPLRVGLKRLYGSLQIGENRYETDENGSILIPLVDPMPGVDGNLNFEVVLNENDTYGTIKAMVNAPIGVPVVEESTFDERTMWSPPTKTPLYLLIFPNLIILGVWLPILILTFNLYRISKSKTQ